MAKAKKKKYARPGDLRQYDKNRDQNRFLLYDQRRIIIKEGSGRNEKVVGKALEALRMKGSDVFRKLKERRKGRKKGRCRPIIQDDSARFFEDAEKFSEKETESSIKIVPAPRVRRI